MNRATSLQQLNQSGRGPGGINLRSLAGVPVPHSHTPTPVSTILAHTQTHTHSHSHQQYIRKRTNNMIIFQFNGIDTNKRDKEECAYSSHPKQVLTPF